MRRVVRAFDRLLRRLQGVFAFWDDPDCIFRVQLAQAPHSMVIPGVQISPGDRVLILHFWNEQIPQIPAEGTNLALALRTSRMVTASFRMLAREMRHDPRMDGVRALGGTTVLFAAGDQSVGEKLFTRLGFVAFPYRSRLGRFGEFWQNAYTWTLMWTYNAASLRRGRLTDLHRTEVWMSSDDFLGRYGTGEAPAPRQPQGKDTKRDCSGDSGCHL